MHSIADGAKTKLGKGFSQAIQKVYRGFTFGGGKGGMLIFIVPNLVRAAVNTAKAEPEEKVSTAIQGGIGAISWVITMPLATKLLYSLGGIKYAGMGKDKVAKYRELIKNFNETAVNLDKATYNTRKEALQEQLKNLRKVKGQNLITKMSRKIASIFTSDLGMIQPHKDSFFGTIVENTSYGVFGIVEDVGDTKLLKVGNIDDVKLGTAYIYTTNTDNRIEKYKIKILDIDKNSSEKNYYFEIVDKDLLKMSGGIVQGMSGSPIVQGDTIIGAVTRVLVDDVSRGYGLDIVTMLEEGDKILNN